MGIALGLMAAVAYGSGDFVAGLGGRRASSALVTLLVQVVGVLAAGAVVLVVAGGGPAPRELVWGGVSGIGSGLGSLVLYHGLAEGRMSVVAPLSAVVTALLPVLVGVATGDPLTGLALVGVVLAFPALALVSWPTSTARWQARDLLTGVSSGGGFALLFIALHQAGTAAGAWPVLSGQVVAMVLVAPVALMAGISSIGARAAVRPGVLAGVLGAGANLLFLAASGAGRLAVVAVLAALYPAVTILLAKVVLAEHWSWRNVAGLAGAAVAVTLLTLA